jgi:murein DD-endopeptidase
VIINPASSRVTALLLATWTQAAPAVFIDFVKFISYYAVMKYARRQWNGGRLLVAAGMAALLFFGCATTPVKHVSGYTQAVADKAARVAVSMVGRPYKYKGDSPSGFDCSGLVRYSYLAAGMDVPHGTKALRDSTRSIGRNMQKGDLLFFNENGGKYSHVGIYLGNNVFVHAPSSGKSVRKDSLQDPYWKKRLLDARRFL